MADVISQVGTIPSQTGIKDTLSEYQHKRNLLAGLTREEKAELIKKERRKRQIQKAKSACKSFLSFLCSHIGLSTLVVLYTFVGGLIFRQLEQDHEKELKRNFTQESDEIIRKINDNFLRYISYNDIKGCDVFKENLIQYYQAIEKNEFSDLKPLDNNLTESQQKDFEAIVNLKGMLFRIMKVTLKKWNNRVREFVQNGWTDEYEERWSIEGSILFAITVITTIGNFSLRILLFGIGLAHAADCHSLKMDPTVTSTEETLGTLRNNSRYGNPAPKTNTGRFMTIIYALIGMPLVFLYLSNIGDYLADIFRILYMRTCRASCEKFCSLSTSTTLLRKLIHLATRRSKDFQDMCSSESGGEELNAQSNRRKNRTVFSKIGQKSSSDQRKEIIDQMIEEGLIPKPKEVSPIRGTASRQSLSKIDTILESNPTTQKPKKNMEILKRNFIEPLMAIMMKPIRGDLNQEPSKISGDPDLGRVIENKNAENMEKGSDGDINILSQEDEFIIEKESNQLGETIFSNQNAQKNEEIFEKELEAIFKHRARPNPEYNATGHQKYHTITKLYRSIDRQKRFEEKTREKQRRYEMEKTRERDTHHNRIIDTWYKNQFTNKEPFNNLFISWYDVDFDLEIQSIDANEDRESLTRRPSQQRSDNDSGVCGETYLRPLRAYEESTDIESDLGEVSNIDIQHSFTFDLNGAKINDNLLPVLDKVKTLKDLSVYKSRFSLISSLPDDPSEVIVCLSYYSRSTNHQISEDISFFTFDQFDSMENLSNINDVTVPISMSLIIMTAYIMFGAMVFSIWDDPDIMKWAYFSFVTLSTIGFGDIVPGTKIDSKNTKEKLIISSLYVAIGLSVFAMCIKLMQEEVVAKVKWLAKRIQAIKKNFQEDEETD